MAFEFHNVPQADLALEDHTCSGELLGQVELAGLCLHVTAIRVTTGAHGIQQAWHAGSNDQCYCVERLDDLYRMDSEGRFTTTTLDGYEGDWVLYATPYK